jgi:hypothetical protein
MGVADFGVRQLGEIGDLQNPIERLDQIAVTAFEHGRIGRRVLRSAKARYRASAERMSSLRTGR